MKFLKVIFFCMLLAGSISCNKHNNEAPPDMGYDYYPGKIHSYIIYDVDSVSYNVVQNDSFKYKFQIKEKFEELFTDNSGRPTYKLVRYKKMYDSLVPYSAMSWTLQDVWMVNINKTNVEVVEENIRYTKLPFPVKQNSKWNGTPRDTVETDYTCTEFDVNSSYNGLSFPKTLTVNQGYSSTLIDYHNHNERYSRGVGLIYKEISDYSYQNGSTVTPGHRYEGIHYVMTINSFGVE